MDQYFETKLIVGAVTLFFFAIGLVAAWWERRTESPIMKTRVNSASDRFFRERGSIWQDAQRFTRGPSYDDEADES